MIKYNKQEFIQLNKNDFPIGFFFFSQLSPFVVDGLFIEFFVMTPPSVAPALDKVHVLY